VITYLPNPSNTRLRSGTTKYDILRGSVSNRSHRIFHPNICVFLVFQISNVFGVHFISKTCLDFYLIPLLTATRNAPFQNLNIPLQKYTFISDCTCNRFFFRTFILDSGPDGHHRAAQNEFVCTNMETDDMKYFFQRGCI